MQGVSRWRARRSVRLTHPARMTARDEKLIGAFVAFFEHGVLVIEHSETEARHDAWCFATEPLRFDFEQDSLYLAVQSLVDGPVAVSVYEDSAPSDEKKGLVEVFSRPFEPGPRPGRLKISDSDEWMILTAPYVPDRVRVTVLVDDPEFPTQVVVELARSS